MRQVFRPHLRRPLLRRLRRRRPGLPRASAPLIVAMALVFSVFGESPAEAQRRGGIALVELELSTDGRRGQGLELHYTLGRRARPDVQLHVSIDRAHRDQDLVATLDHQSGWIPLGRARGRGTVYVTVRATDRTGRTLPIRLGRGLVVTAVELSTDLLVERSAVVRDWGQPPRRDAVRVDGPPERRGGDLRGVAAACDRAFISQAAERECLRQMRGQASAEATIQACDRAFVGQDEALRCLRAIPLPQTVVACDRAFVGEHAALRCLRENPPPRAVAACDRMFVGEDATLRCVDIVGRSQARGNEVDQAFEVCGRRVGESDELACLDDVLSHQRRRPRRRRRRR